jgi:superfamily II DNA or RNA helicase
VYPVLPDALEGLSEDIGYSHLCFFLVGIMATRICKTGYVVLKHTLSPAVLAKIYNELTIYPQRWNSGSVQFGGGAYRKRRREDDSEEEEEDPPVVCYLENEKKLYLPREYGTQVLGPPSEARWPPESYEEIIEERRVLHPEYQPRPCQRPVIEATYKHLNDRFGGVLAVYTGFGKTYIALYVALVLLKCRLLVVVDSSVILEQWHEAARSYFPNIVLGTIQRDKVVIGDVTVAMVQSLVMRDKNENPYPPETFHPFRMVVYDETHGLGGQVYSRVFQLTRCEYTLGLSATPERTDGLSRIFEYYVGPVFLTKKRDRDPNVTVELVDFQNRDPALVKALAVVEARNSQVTIRQKDQIDKWRVDKALAAGHARNMWILLRIREFYKEGRVVLLMTDSREIQIKWFKEHLGLSHWVCDLKTQYNKEKGALRKRARIFLGCYVQVGKAIDLPTLNTIILATSRSAGRAQNPETKEVNYNIEQWVGRMMRKPTDIEPRPLLLDLSDKVPALEFMTLGTGTRKKYVPVTSQSVAPYLDNLRKGRVTYYNKQGYTKRLNEVNLDGVDVNTPLPPLGGPGNEYT